MSVYFLVVTGVFKRKALEMVFLGQRLNINTNLVLLDPDNSPSIVRSHNVQECVLPHSLVNRVIAAVLWYNSHIIQCTHLKCIVVFSICTDCASITVINHRKFSLHQKETPYPLIVPPVFPPPSPWQPLNAFLTLRSCLF